MKNKNLLKVLIVIICAVCLTACGKKVDLSNIVEKFNNSDTVKTYKSYGYDIVASSTKDTLTISSTREETKKTVEFKLNGNILSNENIANEDISIALLVIDSVGQVNGYKDGELAKNMNAFSEEIKSYTLKKEGIEIAIGDDSTSLKIDLSKKIPLIDMNKFYLKTDDFDMISQFVKDKTNGNQSGKVGNIAYDVTIGDKESTIQIGQEDKLSDSAYKSILSALEVMYGKDVATHFQKLYPKFVDDKITVEAFTIETNYKNDDQEESMFKDTQMVLVTINNKKIK